VSGGLDALLGVLFIGLCGASAAVVWRRAGPVGTARWLAAATAFMGVFVLAFHVAGGAELITGRALVSLPLVTAAAGGLCAVVWLISRALPVSGMDARVAEASPPRWRRVPALTALLVLGGFGVLALLLVGSWPQGFEAQAYHVPLAVRVLHEGTLRIWDGSWMHAYPINMSLWAGFWIDLLPERLVALANLPFLALCAAALYALSRGAGADRNAALLMACGLTTIPLFAFGALQVSADLGGVAFIAIAMYFVLVQPLPVRACAAMGGFAAGLAFGFKSLHLVPLGLLGLALLFGSASGGRFPQRLGALGVYALSALLPMTYWLVRNYVERGNPLYPVYVPGVFNWLGWLAPADQHLLSNTGNEREWVSAGWRWLLYPWQEGHATGQNFKHSSGLGPFFAATAPVALALGPLAAWARPAGQGRRVHLQLLALALGILAVWWLLGDRQPRYFMAAIVPLLALAGWQLTQTSGRLRTAYEALLASGILLMLLPPLLGQARATLGGLSHGHLAPRYMRHEYPPALDRLPAGSRVVNGYERSVNLPLMGAGLGNRVVDLLEARRRFGATDGGWRFDADSVRALGATHFYVREGEKIDTDGCVTLREIDALRANPYNGKPYAQGRVLYAIDLCEAAK
jgi:hypothetical protein